MDCAKKNLDILLEEQAPINWDCLDFTLPERIQKYMNIPPKYYEENNYSKIKDKATCSIAFEFIKGFHLHEKDNVLITGADKCWDKTLLGVLMLKQFKKAGRGNGFYVYFPDMAIIKKEDKPIESSEPAYTMWREMHESDLLVVDYLGYESLTNYNGENYTQVLYKFLFNRPDHKKKTIFITELSQSELLSAYGEHFIKRLTDLRVTEILNLKQ